MYLQRSMESTVTQIFTLWNLIKKIMPNTKTRLASTEFVIGLIYSVEDLKSKEDGAVNLKSIDCAMNFLRRINWRKSRKRMMNRLKLRRAVYITLGSLH